MDGVFHPSQVTEEYVARLLREYSAIICFWILLDYIGKADRHYATGTFTRISMEIGDKDYSIVHVPVGAEKLCSSNIAKAGETRYFVVVDDVSQIPLIKGEKIHSFATVSKTGRIQYYRK